MRAAREILEKRPMFLDTETTGLGPDDEIVEVVVIDTDGTVLLESLVRPTKAIPARATEIHGIRDADVTAAPTFAELWPRLGELLMGRPVVIYNAEYDLRMLRQSARACRVACDLAGVQAHCAMELYAEFWGDWSDYFGSYKWQRLEEAARQQRIRVVGAHRARADAELARQVMMAMAVAEEGESTDGG